MRALALAAVFLMRLTSADAFDSQGHRGARGLAPENTLAAFETALSIRVTTLELDIAMTRDGVLVVRHDRRLDRITRAAPMARSSTSRARRSGR